MKHQKCWVNQVLVVGRDVGDVVNGFIERGVGVDVGSELDAVVLQIVEHGLAGVVLGAVEGHMFQEVRQACLVVLLLHGADFLSDVEIGSVFRLPVMPDVIGQAILQLSCSHLRIHRKGRVLLCRGRKRCDKQQHGENFSHVTFFLIDSRWIDIIFIFKYKFFH